MVAQNTSSAKPTCCRELRKFGELTSMKGVGRAIKTEDRCLKVMWVFAVIGFLCVTIFNVWNLTDEFLQFGSTTKIIERSVDYFGGTSTEILLCNVNPFSPDKIDETVHLISSYRQLIQSWTSDDSAQADPDNLGNVHDELLTGHRGFFQHIGPRKASEISHSLQKFILSCHIYFLDGVMEKSMSCSKAGVKITKVLNNDFFNCFKVHGEGKHNRIPSVGMSFLLYAPDAEVNSSVALGRNTGKGAIVALGQKGSLFHPSHFGAELLSNMVNYVRFRKIERKRLPDPYGICIKKQDIKRETYNSPYTYTEDSCLSSCIELKIVQACKCQDVGQFGILSDMFGNVSTCGATGMGREFVVDGMQCVQRLRSRFRQECLSVCAPPCLENVFDKKLTYLELSAPEVHRMLEREKVDGSVSGVDSSHRHEFLKELTSLNISNLALVHIRRDTNSYFVVEDTKAMTINDWLAKIGGTLNLWSGITLFVLVEALDLLVRIFRKPFSNDAKIVNCNCCACVNPSDSFSCECDKKTPQDQWTCLCNTFWESLIEQLWNQLFEHQCCSRFQETLSRRKHYEWSQFKLFTKL